MLGIFDERIPGADLVLSDRGVTVARRTLVRNRVRELRERSTLTQTDLGEIIGVTRQTVAAIEQERYSPSLETAFRIARELDVTARGCLLLGRAGKGLSLA
jgi:putative transcriptional regulator